MRSLEDAVEAAARLCGQRDHGQQPTGTVTDDGEQNALARRLQDRLRAFDELLGGDLQDRGVATDVKALQSETGCAALQAILAIQQAAVAADQQSSSSSHDAAPLLGARDTQTIRTTLGIVSNWYLAPLIATYDASLQGAGSRAPKLQEVQEEDKAKVQRREVFQRARTELYKAVVQLDNLLRSEAKTDTPLKSIILSTCALPILGGAIRIGWGPIAMHATTSNADADKQHSTAAATRLLKAVPTSTSLNLLSGVTQRGASGSTSVPRFVKATTEMLFAAQLLRADGVMALLRNTFTSDEADEDERGSMKKLVGVGQLLSTPPRRMPIEVFAAAIVPRLLEVVGAMPADARGDAAARRYAPNEQATLSQKNAACFALARLAEVTPQTSIHEALEQHVYRFIRPRAAASDQIGETAVTAIQLARALELLFELVNQSEPSSGLVVQLLSSVVAPLFVIHAFVTEGSGDKRPTIALLSDGKGKAKQPTASTTGEVAASLFTTWLRLSELDDSTVRLAPRSREGLFALSEQAPGTLAAAVEQSSIQPALAFGEQGGLTVKWQDASRKADLRSALDGIRLEDLGVKLSLSDEDDAAPALPAGLLSAMQLIPSPTLLAACIKQAQRKDVAAMLLVAVLDAYAQAKRDPHSANTTLPTQGILYIQHILQLIEAFGSDVLQGQPDKVLSFVEFALGRGTGAVRSERQSKTEAEGSGAESVPFLRPASDSSALSGLLNVSNGGVQGTGEGREEEEEEEDEEVVETALNLLLSLLESTPTMTADTHSLLKVISAKVQALTTSSSSSIRPLANEASLVLKARQSASSVQSTTADASLLTPREAALAKGRAKYREALTLLQDPILPVRAHGLIELKQLVAFGTTDDTQGTLLDPTLTPSILDIFLQAVCDDESYLYLNAVKGLAEMCNTGGQTMVQRLVALYVGDADSLAAMTQTEVDKRLRVGEALLQVVQKLETALAAYAGDVVAPLLTAVRDAAYPTTLRTSMLSIVGTCIEACPAAMIAQGYSDAVADAMTDLLSVEVDVVHKPSATDERRQDDALERDAKAPHFRRAALLLLSLLVRGATMQLQAVVEGSEDATGEEDVVVALPTATPRITELRMPGGGSIAASTQEARRVKSEGVQQEQQQLLFHPSRQARLDRVAGYVAQFDSDELARHQASEVQDDLNTFNLYLVHAAAPRG